MEQPRSGLGAPPREVPASLGRVSEFCQKCRHGVSPAGAKIRARASVFAVKLFLCFFNGKEGRREESGGVGRQERGKGSGSENEGEGAIQQRREGAAAPAAIRR